MASGSDVAEAVGDITADLAAALSLNDAPACPTEDTVTEMTQTWLETLPLEILEIVAGYLDWTSLLSLQEVSAHCRDAVGLVFGRLHTVQVYFYSGDAFHLECTVNNRPPACDAEGSLTSSDKFYQLMSQLTSLRRLDVSGLSSERLETLSAVSTYWTQLEQLDVRHDYSITSDPTLLNELCANCPLLTDLSVRSLGWTALDETLKSVAVALPGLRSLHVQHEGECSFLSELPAGLRELSIESPALRSEAVAELARLTELRSLRLGSGCDLEANHLKACLAGCVRLERLALGRLRGSVGNCLPATGLPALRYLELEWSRLGGTDMGHLVDCLPGLESIHQWHCQVLTRDELALFGRLPALRSLKLYSTYSGITDETLNELSSARLVELELGLVLVVDDYGRNFPITPEGLLQLTRACPTLRTVMLKATTPCDCTDCELRIKCGPGVDKGDLLQTIRHSLAELAIAANDPLLYCSDCDESL